MFIYREARCKLAFLLLSTCCSTPVITINSFHQPLLTRLHPGRAKMAFLFQQLPYN